MGEINQGETIEETIKKTKDGVPGSTSYKREWQMNRQPQRILRNLDNASRP